jgi:hypothetical protein
MRRPLLAPAAALVAGVAMVVAGLVGVGSAGAASTTFSLTFATTTTGSVVVRWAPCIKGSAGPQVIDYRVHTAGRPGRVDLVKQAIRRLHDATGLSFHYAGRTSYIPQSERLVQRLNAAAMERRTGVPLVVAGARKGNVGGRRLDHLAIQLPLPAAAVRRRGRHPARQVRPGRRLRRRWHRRHLAPARARSRGRPAARPGQEPGDVPGHRLLEPGRLCVRRPRRVDEGRGRRGLHVRRVDPGRLTQAQNVQTTAALPSGAYANRPCRPPTSNVSGALTRSPGSSSVWSSCRGAPE